jgi:hypothetical protein
METDGYHFDGPYKTVQKGYTTKALGITYKADHWTLALQRNEETKRLLSALPLRHQEKISIKSLILRTGAAARWDSIRSELDGLRNDIARQVSDYASRGELILSSRPDKTKLV